MNGERREAVPEPRVLWTDYVARWLRANTVVVGMYSWFAERLVPLLFAVIVAAPIGVLMLPFFIPKFVRNAQRRKRYGVRLEPTPTDRIAGTSHPPT